MTLAGISRQSWLEARHSGPHCGPRAVRSPSPSRVAPRNWGGHTSCIVYKQMYGTIMQRSYSIADARSRLAEIIDEVEGGEDVEIVRRGKKVAVLVSPARYARMAGKKTAFGDAYDAFMKGRDPKVFGLEPEEIEEFRDRAPGRTIEL